MTQKNSSVMRLHGCSAHTAGCCMRSATTTTHTTTTIWVLQREAQGRHIMQRHKSPIMCACI